MAHFQTVPGGERISGRTITVDRPTFAVGLWGPLESANQELDVRTDDPRVTVTRGALASNVRTWTVSGPDGARANVTAVASNGSAWDGFEIGFQKASAGAATAVSVWPITRDILGTEDVSHLTGQTVPTFAHIAVPTFRAGDWRNAPDFSGQPSSVARVGVFACSNGRHTRAVIVLLPGTGIPDAVLVGVTHGFGQNAGYYSQMGWADPLSPNLIIDVGRRFVHPSNPRAHATIGLFDYLHNYCMPNYCLYLGIQLC